MPVLEPEWVDSAFLTLQIEHQFEAIDRDIRISTFGDGDPNFSD